MTSSVEEDKDRTLHFGKRNAMCITNASTPGRSQFALACGMVPSGSHRYIAAHLRVSCLFMVDYLSKPASFLNLDLDLQASFDLSPIAEDFGSRVFVLYCGEIGDGYRLSVEPVFDGLLSSDATACTEFFLRLADGLSQKNKDLWRTCDSRVFDYGFEGGYEENTFHADISADNVARMARLRIELRVTIYPFRASDDDEVGV